MKAILFDFGGTVDTNGIHWSEYFWDAYQQLKVPVTKNIFEQAYCAAEGSLPGVRIRQTDNFSATVRAQVQGQIEFLLASGYHFEPTLPDRIARLCISGVHDVIKNELPFLKRIGKRYKLGLVSNYYGNLAASLAELGLTPVFHTAIDSTVAGISKPDPAIFQHALDALHAQPAEAYVVGDSYERDIVPAKRLGCVTVWLRGRSWQETANTAEADYVIVTLEELGQLLRM